LGYSVMICTTGGESAQELEFLNMLAKKRADGAILLASVMQSRELEKYARQYPIVQCSEYEPGTKIAHISVDNYKAARQAVDYLLQTGHTRIATISSVNGYPSTRLRLKGYHDALREAGIPVTEEYIRYGSFDYSFQSGVVAAEGLLSLEQRPTAIFCISDMLALGAVNGARGLGLRVPEDVSILGFDDVEHATMFRPQITTMAQPCYQLGECAAELLYDLMRGESAKPREIMLPSELKIRASTKSGTGEDETA
ncbi:MAG TPA: substrate-binding domain-containing protein, partial [Feifaniaceae bacterium]|nr:substrate-binding domain-containing protein [Feifaniaceae bacterium]